MQPIIEIKNLSKRYKLGSYQAYQTLRDSIANAFKKRDEEKLKKNEFWALKNVSFNVNQGEIVGVIGRNGAGKSTLLKILSRITPPTSGTAILRGRVASLLEVGTGFSSELSGRDNVFLSGAVLGMSRKEIKRRFDEIVDFSGIEKFIDTPVKYYSSGMYMRLAFAVASNLDADILLIDEVLAVGDINFQNKSLGKMRKITTSEGKTVIFVSHNMDMIGAITERCVWIDSGTIKSIGETTKIVSQYLGPSSFSGKNLSAWQDRSGNKDAVINGLRLLTSDKKVHNGAYRPGEPICVETEIFCKKKLKLNYGIVIENADRQSLFATHLLDSTNEYTQSGKLITRVLISGVNLVSGKYYGTLVLYDPVSRERYDIVNNYPLFEITGASFGNVKFPIDNRRGNFFFPLDWEVLKNG